MASYVSSARFFGPKVTLFRAETHVFSGRKSHFFGPKLTFFRAENHAFSGRNLLGRASRSLIIIHYCVDHCCRNFLFPFFSGVPDFLTA